MALQAPAPPDEAVDALRGALGALGDRGQLGVRALRRAQPEQVTVTAPHEVFTLGLDDLRERPSLRDAKPSAWRFFLEVDREVVASAETTTISAREHEFSHVNEGPFVAGTVAALEIAERWADERNEDFDFRLVHIPAIYSVNVWAHRRGADTHDEDLLVPAAPAPPGVEANRPYAPDELLEILSGLARDVPELGPDDARGG
jgi:hypothetical protein